MSTVAEHLERGDIEVSGCDLVTLMQVASEAYAEWKEHRDMRAGKLLRALADPTFTKYRRDLDAARALAKETAR